MRVHGLGITSPRLFTTTSSKVSEDTPVLRICAAKRSISAKASASVACSLNVVASRPRSRPHGCATRYIAKIMSPNCRLARAAHHSA